MYSLATQPATTPTTRNRTVKKEPNTKLAANIFLASGNYFSFPRTKGKFKIDGYFPIEKANHLFEDDVKRVGLLSSASIKNNFNATIKVVFWFIYVGLMQFCFL